MQASDYADLVLAAQEHMNNNTWTDLAHDLQQYYMMAKLFKRDAVITKSGRGENFKIRTERSSVARNVGLYDTDQSNVTNLATEASVPWRMTTNNYSFDTAEEEMNSGKARLYDHVKMKRVACLSEIAEKVEEDGWGKPADSDNTTDPWGVLYWIVKNASTGFYGGIPSGFSDVAGVSPTDYSNWRNYTGRYTLVSSDDLLPLWRQASRYTKFKPPVSTPSIGGDAQYGYYANYAVISDLEDLMESRNDNLGRDLNSKKVLFRGVEINDVPFLDADTQNPIYGIDWGVFKAIFLKRMGYQEHKPKVAPNQRNVIVVHFDLRYNFVCYDRRKNFVLNIA